MRKFIKQTLKLSVLAEIGVSLKFMTLRSELQSELPFPE